MTFNKIVSNTLQTWLSLKWTCKRMRTSTWFLLLNLIIKNSIRNKPVQLQLPASRVALATYFQFYLLKLRLVKLFWIFIFFFSRLVTLFEFGFGSNFCLISSKDMTMVYLKGKWLICVVKKWWQSRRVRKYHSSNHHKHQQKSCGLFTT